MRRYWYPAECKLPTATGIIFQHTISALQQSMRCTRSANCKLPLASSSLLFCIELRNVAIVRQQDSADWQATSGRDMHKQAQTGTNRHKQARTGSAQREKETGVETRCVHVCNASTIMAHISANIATLNTLSGSCCAQLHWYFCSIIFGIISPVPEKGKLCQLQR